MGRAAKAGSMISGCPVDANIFYCLMHYAPERRYAYATTAAADMTQKIRGAVCERLKELLDEFQKSAWPNCFS